MRRAKIVCTLGPATSTPERIAALVEAGMDVARLNFSHGSHDDHEQVYNLVREAADAAGRAVGDPRRPAGTQDPPRQVRRRARTAGDRRRRSPSPATTSLGTRDRVSCTYTKLPQEVQAGRPAAHRRRQGRRRGHRRRRQRHPLPASSRAARSPTTRASRCPTSRSACPRCRDKDAETCASRCGSASTWSRCRSCARPTTSSSSTRSWTRRASRCPVIAKIEKPEAVDRLEAIVDCLRRRHGRPR